MTEGVFTTVSVGGAPPVEFCVDPEAGDPVARWFLENDRIDEPVHRVFLGLVKPGAAVVDLGCHLGTFSLAAAALGARVISVDAARRHVELLGVAAARNGFDELQAVQGAVSRSKRPVSFVERNIHGRLAVPSDSDVTTVETVTVDRLVRARGWDSVDLVKLDIEGAELAALDGMRELFASGCRPDFVFESNGSMLPVFGNSIERLRSRFEHLGYELFLIDNLRPGILVEAPSDTLQPECVSDYVATVHGRERLEELWTVEPPFDEIDLITRLLDQAASGGSGYRRYAAETLRAAPRWLHEQPSAQLAARTLELDCEREVRNALPGPRARWRIPTRGASPNGRPARTAVFADGLTLRAHRRELDHLHGRSARDPRPLLENVSFHVRPGQLVGLYGDTPETTSALLRALAGYERPASGRLDVASPALLLSDLAGVLELELSVLDNLEILIAFLGGDMTSARHWLDDVAARAAVAGRLDLPLGELKGSSVIRLALGCALRCAQSALVLIDRLPRVDEHGFHEWAVEHTWHLRHTGAAIVQAVSRPDELLGPADRLLWFAGPHVIANGHPESVVDAIRRRDLGLDRQRQSVYWAVPA